MIVDAELVSSLLATKGAEAEGQQWERALEREMQVTPLVPGGSGKHDAATPAHPHPLQAADAPVATSGAGAAPERGKQVPTRALADPASPAAGRTGYLSATGDVRLAAQGVHGVASTVSPANAYRAAMLLDATTRLAERSGIPRKQLWLEDGSEPVLWIRDYFDIPAERQDQIVLELVAGLRAMGVWVDKVVFNGKLVYTEGTKHGD